MSKMAGNRGSGCRTVLIVLLVIILVIAAGAFIFFKVHEDEIMEQMSNPSTDVVVGETAPEFDVTTTDGDKVSMSGLLEGKEALAVVLFATWCGPCEKEFPEMDKVYQKYQDKMGMIALDIDVLDDEKSAKEYADSHGLSFPVAYARDLTGYKASAFPTTLIIDRNGKVGFCRMGAIPDQETFEKVVTTFMGDDYQERQLGYNTFYAYGKKIPVPGVEFSVTTESGTETYTTGEEGEVDVFTDKAGNLKVKVISVPDGYTIDEGGEITTGPVSTLVKLPVSAKG